MYNTDFNFLDELLIFDVFYIVSYFTMMVYYYSVEYKNRYDFYTHKAQIEFQKSYKHLLRKLPVGIVLFDKENNPIFFNNVISAMMGKRSARSSIRSLNQDKPDRKTQKKEVRREEN